MPAIFWQLPCDPREKHASDVGKKNGWENIHQNSWSLNTLNAAYGLIGLNEAYYTHIMYRPMYLRISYINNVSVRYQDKIVYFSGVNIDWITVFLVSIFFTALETSVLYNYIYYIVSCYAYNCMISWGN